VELAPEEKRGQRWGRLKYALFCLLMFFIFIVAARFMVPGMYKLEPDPVGYFTLSFIRDLAIALAAIKRFHDFGKSGWFCLLVFIPGIGALTSLVLFFIPGSRKTNQYGPKPAMLIDT